MTAKHQDILTTEQAAAYVGLPSEKAFRDFAAARGVRPLPWGRGLWHRRHLDEVVDQAAAGDPDTLPASAKPRGRFGHGRETNLKNAV